ncbi:hypothetical protein BHM03_00003446 [Ensete ventricosum]|nr:hypothetical protein BHM03_00003446 [Ensete ventricosum]
MSEEGLRANLDLISERRAEAHLQALKYRTVVARLHNYRVHPWQLKVGDLVLHKVEINNLTSYVAMMFLKSLHELPLYAHHKIAISSRRGRPFLLSKHPKQGLLVEEKRRERRIGGAREREEEGPRTFPLLPPHLPIASPLPLLLSYHNSRTLLLPSPSVASSSTGHLYSSPPCCRQPPYPHLPCRSSYPKCQHARSLLPSAVAVLPRPCTAIARSPPRCHIVAATPPLQQPLPTTAIPSSTIIQPSAVHYPCRCCLSLLSLSLSNLFQLTFTAALPSSHRTPSSSPAPGADHHLPFSSSVASTVASLVLNRNHHWALLTLMPQPPPSPALGHRPTTIASYCPATSPLPVSPATAVSPPYHRRRPSLPTLLLLSSSSSSPQNSHCHLPSQPQPPPFAVPAPSFLYRCSRRNLLLSRALLCHRGHLYSSPPLLTTPLPPLLPLLPSLPQPLSNVPLPCSPPQSLSPTTLLHW